MPKNMNYNCHWCAEHVPARPVAKVKQDKKQYVYVDELTQSRKKQFLEAAEKLNKKYHHLIEESEFINALKQEFGASVVIQKTSFDRAMSFKG